VIAIRCTARLLGKLGLPARLPVPGPSSSVLGDWYATVVYRRTGPLILAASDRSLLPLVFPARLLRQFEAQFFRELRTLLLALGIEESRIQAEFELMQPVSFAATGNPSLVGILNNLMFLLGGLADDSPHLTPLELALRMSEVPFKPIGYGFPVEVACRLLGSPRRRPHLTENRA
jgi:hypothetical protein